MNSRTRIMLEMYKSGIDMSTIAKQHGISRQRIDQILKPHKISRDRKCRICGKPFQTRLIRQKVCGDKRCQRRMAKTGAPFLTEKQVLSRRLGEITKQISPPTTGGCWVWTGNVNPVTGYGRVGWGGKCIYTHRWMWQQVYGIIPDGLFVLHRCDNPPCINPYHLWLGTALDNARDRDAKGRGARKFRKFNDQQARAIRRQYAAGMGYGTLGKMYSAAPNTIKKIVKKETYRDML